MIGVAHPAAAPKLSTTILRITVIVAAFITGVMGVEYWLEQDYAVMAGATVIAEIVAVLAPPEAARRFRSTRFAGVIGIVLTVMAAGWCGGTTWAKLDADFSARAAAAISNTPAYQDAERAHAAAADALRVHWSAQPPDCTCPATITAWQASHEARAALLERARASAETRLRAATPEHRVNPWDIARAVFLETLKLLGLIAFGEPTPAPIAPRRRSLHGAIAAGLSRGAALTGALGLGASMAAQDVGDLGAQLAAPKPRTEELVEPTPELVQPAAKSALRRAKQAKARDMELAGMHKTEIARILGVHRNTVHNWLRLGA